MCDLPENDRALIKLEEEIDAKIDSISSLGTNFYFTSIHDKKVKLDFLIKLQDKISEISPLLVECRELLEKESKQ